MKKKLLAALILSMAVAVPQANADPSALEQAYNDPTNPNYEKLLLPKVQKIQEGLNPRVNESFEINSFDDEPYDHYYSIYGNGKSGFSMDNYGGISAVNVKYIDGFNTTGNGGAFNMTNDSYLEMDTFMHDGTTPLLTTIRYNKATGKGGAIYSQGHYSNMTHLMNVSVKNNKAGAEGGGLYMDYGIGIIDALPGTTVEFTGNKAVIGGKTVNNDIYLYTKPQEWVRGSLKLYADSSDVASTSEPWGKGIIVIDDMRAASYYDVLVASSKENNSELRGGVAIGKLWLDGTSSFSTAKVAPNQQTDILIGLLDMKGDSVLNTVNNYIESNMYIGTIKLTGSNTFKVDANLKEGELAIDHFNTVNGGNIKLAVNVMPGANTDGGTLTLFDSGNATITGSKTQYGDYKYSFSEAGTGKISYTKERATTLKEALADLSETSYDMPDVTVADSNLGYLAYDTNVGPRTFTINGQNGILTTDGGEYSGIQIWSSFYGDADGSKLIIKDLAAFNGFTSKYTDGAYGHEGFGGAINAHQALLDIDNVTFANNIATGDPTLTTKRTSGNGGAIYIQSYYDNENPEDIKIKDSTFVNNKAISVGPTGFVPGENLSRGGAINSLGPMNILNTLFSNNSAITQISGGEAQGGAIRATRALSEIIEGDDVAINDSMFMYNVAGDVENEGEQLLNVTAFGGALYSYQINPNISNTAFIANMAQAAGDRESEFDPGHYLTAKSQGGAIYVDPERSLNTMDIYGSTFAMNKTQNVKSVDNGDGTYTLTTEGVDQSQSLGGALALMTYPSPSGMPLLTVNINNTDFIANTSGNGGAIFNMAAELNIKDSTFTGNRASIEGGAIHNGAIAQSKAILNLDNVTFSNNYARSGEDTIKNDINNYATVNFVGSASKLDGGIFGYYNGTTNFNLDDGNSMDIGNKTYISQRFVNIAEGTTLNVDSGFSLNVYSQLENNGNLNIKSGWLLPSDATSGNVYINNGTMTLGSAGQDVELVHTQLANYGTIQGGDSANKLVNNGGTITNNITGIINMDIANSPFAAGTLTEADLEAYKAGTLTDADTLAYLNDTGIAAAIDSDAIDTANLGASSFGNLVNDGVINGNIGNKHGEIINNITGIITGDIDNRDGYLENYGAITGDITDNNSGQISNAEGASITGDIHNISGELYNDGTINGEIATSTTSSFHIGKFFNNENGVVNGKVSVLDSRSIASNNGVIDATAATVNQLVTNEGTFTNNGTIIGGLDNYGTFLNTQNGIVDTTTSDLDSISNSSSGTIISAGAMTTDDLTNNGVFVNGVNPSDPEEIVPTATFEGDIENSNSLYNAGIISGDIDNYSSAIAVNDGTINGDFDNSDNAQFTNNSVINGDTSNNDDAVFVNNGTINGYADNFDDGQFTNNGTIDNSKAADEQYVVNEGTYVNNGNIIGGLENQDGTFTNNGSIDATGTDSDYFENDGIMVNMGSVTAASIDNSNIIVNGVDTSNPDATNPNATITGDITNSSMVANAGKITGDITNTSGTTSSMLALYKGGSVEGNVTGGNLMLAGGDGTVTGDVTGMDTIMMTSLTGVPTGELRLGGDVSTTNFIADGGTLNLQNGATNTADLGNVILADTVNVLIDADMANSQVDTISADSFTDAGENASFNIAGMNIVGDNESMDGKTLDIFNGNEAAREVLKDHISMAASVTEYNPLYEYNGVYDAATGTMKVSKKFNPAVMVGAVAAQAGGYLTQLNSYDQAFYNMDTYMLMTSDQRQAMKMRNKYAAGSDVLAYDSTKNAVEYKGGWFNPYVTFENVKLKNGPKVKNNLYGSYFGLDSGIQELSNGWDGIWGVYAGYNGSHQHFDGVSAYQNGGTLGLNGMLYKNNFFTGLTANVGASAGNATTMYGHEDFAMLMTGVASKTGYNWELANGKLTIQPSYMMSYSFVDTFDYTNAAGVRIESDPLHAIQIQPELKIIGNLKYGWQPYASVAMVWNIMDDTKFKANDVALPEMSVKPFVKYGVGVRKTWGERFTGFLQAFITNGGRNGVGLQAGFRFAVGKDPSGCTSKKAGTMPEKKETKISLNNIK